MSAGLLEQLRRQDVQKDQRQLALRVLFCRPGLPPRHRTVVLLVPELVTRPGVTWDTFAQLVGVTTPTAKAYLRELRTWGVLEAAAGAEPCDLRLASA